MNDDDRARLDAALRRVPEHMREGLRDYILHGRLPGGFLTAVLKNDLAEAAIRADDINSARLSDFVAFLILNAPAACWGSSGKVHAWCEHGGLKGLGAAHEQADAEDRARLARVGYYRDHAQPKSASWPSDP